MVKAAVVRGTLKEYSFEMGKSALGFWRDAKLVFQLAYAVPGRAN
jgi:hypothetical protein